jgi:dephospho-CoA kinase
MDQPIVLAIIGMPGSGKSLVCQHLVDQGFPVVYFGGIVLKEVDARGYARLPKYEKEVREDLRAKHGMGAIALLALPEIESQLKQSQVVFIDGLYSMAEYKILKKRFDARLIIIAIFTEKSKRYTHLANRPVRPLTREEAEKRDLDEVERIEKGGPIALADYMLLNNETPEELLHQVDTLLSRLIQS